MKPLEPTALGQNEFWARKVLPRWGGWAMMVAVISRWRFFFADGAWLKSAEGFLIDESGLTGEVKPQ